MPHINRPTRICALTVLVFLGCHEPPTAVLPASARTATKEVSQTEVTESGAVSVTLNELPMPCDYPGAKCGRFAYGYAINDLGTVVGTAEFHSVLDLYNFDAAEWPLTGGVVRAAAVIPGLPSPLMVLYGINNGGDVLATSYWSPHDVFVNKDKISPLPGYSDPASSEHRPVAINNAREVIGYATTQGRPERAFVWSPGVGTRALEYRLEGTTESSSSRPSDINDLGMAVGVVDRRGVLWDTHTGSVTELAPLLGVLSATPTGINNNGEIVGSVIANATSLSAGFFWSPVSGLRILDPHSATAINDSSVVIGDGYVWTPRHGRLTMVLPHGDLFTANIGGKLNNLNQIPGWVHRNGYMCCSNAARFDLHLPPPNAKPAAKAGGPYTDREGRLIEFDGSASSDPENQPLTYDWSFGDGSVSAASKPRHSYVDNGSYVVRLIVTDPVGAADTVYTSAMISNVTPTVVFDSPMLITSGQTFTARMSFTDPGIADAPWKYRIDWGNGASTDGVASAWDFAIGLPSPAYCASGTYALTAGVTDKDGGIGSIHQTLKVERIEIPVTVLAETLNPRAKGELPVAVLSTASFNSKDLDVASVRMTTGTNAAPVSQHQNGEWASAIADVNGDGRADLVLHFDRQTLAGGTNLTASITKLEVLGRLIDGCREVHGSATVRVLDKTRW